MVSGGTMRDSFLVDGVAFNKTFSYAGIEQRPKRFVNPTVLLLNIEFELKWKKENAEIQLSDTSQYQSMVDAEWNIFYGKLDRCVTIGTKIILSRLAIRDLATQFFADRDIFCAGRVTEEDLHRVVVAIGAAMQTSVNNVIDERLGSCDLFEEKQVGNGHFRIFSGCQSGSTATIVLRGIADSYANFVWEPSAVKINAINAATEAACLVFCIDESVKNPKSESVLITVEMKADEDNVLVECSTLWSVDFVKVCENHPQGIILVKFKDRHDAQKCIALLNGRWFCHSSI